MRDVGLGEVLVVAQHDDRPLPEWQACDRVREFVVAELVTAVLNRNGFDAELLNGDLPQKERERVMAKVKRGEVAFMVATDLAARGIDISDLSHVINYSLPEDPAVYLHRVGRTGRIGKKGTALNLISGKELATFTALEKSRQPWHGETGWIDREMLARHLDGLAAPIYYSAGPPAMVAAMREMLLHAGVDEDDVRTEDFAGY